MRQIESRCEAKVVKEGDAPLTVELTIEPGIGDEGFKIADGPNGTIRIIGNDARGVLYGVGKFLHTSTYGSQGFTPSTWRGVSVPKMPVRGMYLATHMENYYHVAPVEEMTRYMEDLSLWGVNSFLVWFDLEQYDGINDPKAQKHLDRLRVLLKMVKDLGLNASLGCIANGGYKNSPAELRADDSTVDRRTITRRMGPRIYNMGPELCPSKPGVHGNGTGLLPGEVRRVQGHRLGLLVHRALRQRRMHLREMRSLGRERLSADGRTDGQSLQESLSQREGDSEHLVLRPLGHRRMGRDHGQVQREEAGLGRLHHVPTISRNIPATRWTMACRAVCRC